MARVLQALLLICGFCAPVLAAFAMENPAVGKNVVTDLFLGDNTSGKKTHTVNEGPSGLPVGLTDDTNGSLPKGLSSRPATGIKNN